jgi:hypothetical protein
MVTERRGAHNGFDAHNGFEMHAFMGIPAFHRRGRPMSGQGFGTKLMGFRTVGLFEASV